MNPMDILKFHKPYFPDKPLDLDAFHEWNVEFALEKFKAKPDNDSPVTFFNFDIGRQVRILETPYRGTEEKYLIFDLVRSICAKPQLGVTMVSFICEAWVASVSEEEMKANHEAGLQVRHIPGREDCLMVSTFHRDGGVRCTRWVVKLKKDPAKNIMLARDDLDMDKGGISGEAVYFFSPAR